jgi:uncharacterized membrane-anchored protein YhcB (DUF1043 family)
MNVSQQSQPDLVNIDLVAFQAESLEKIDRLRIYLNDELTTDISEIKEGLIKSFRHFLLTQEQERMPFLQRVMTAHIENMEDERGFPPRHPIHWFKSKLEFSSTGVLEFDFKKDAEAFMELALTEIESEIKQQLAVRQQATLDSVNANIQKMQQDLAAQIQPVAKARKTIATEYVNSFIRPNRLSLKAVDRFYFVSAGVRFDPKQELIYSEVCVRPTGIFDRSGGNKTSQLKYAISCDRLLEVVNESIGRSIGQIQQQTRQYLTGELSTQIDRLFAGLIV